VLVGALTAACTLRLNQPESATFSVLQFWTFLGSLYFYFIAKEVSFAIVSIFSGKYLLVLKS
jgi:hypothetical protein